MDGPSPLRKLFGRVIKPKPNASARTGANASASADANTSANAMNTMYTDTIEFGDILDATKANIYATHNGNNIIFLAIYNSNVKFKFVFGYDRQNRQISVNLFAKPNSATNTNVHIKIAEGYVVNDCVLEHMIYILDNHLNEYNLIMICIRRESVLFNLAFNEDAHKFLYKNTDGKIMVNLPGDVQQKQNNIENTVCDVIAGLFAETKSFPHTKVFHKDMDRLEQISTYFSGLQPMPLNQPTSYVAQSGTYQHPLPSAHPIPSAPPITNAPPQSNAHPIPSAPPPPVAPLHGTDQNNSRIKGNPFFQQGGKKRIRKTHKKIKTRNMKQSRKSHAK